jgi:hypothetical protein
VITIAFDLAEFRKKARQMGIFADDQLPFAISKTLNGAVLGSGGARDKIVNEAWPKAFKVRRSNFGRASTAVGKAGLSTKTKWSVELDGDRLKRGSLPQHARSGIKSPRNRHLAIPAPQIEAKRGASGIPRALRPRTIVGKIAPRALRITSKGIFEGRGGKLHRLYGFVSRASLRQRYQFDSTFQRVVTQRVREDYPRHIQHAVSTAFR